MDFWTLLMQILLLLTGAFLMGVLAERLRQSPIIGYLFAGVLIGPLLFNRQAVSELSELGVALLMFSIGLEFSFQRLKRLGSIALGGGTLQVCATSLIFALGFYIFKPLGESLALGAMIALSSTAVVMRVLVDRAEIDSQRGRNALGILLLQDISVVPLVIMVNIIGEGGVGNAIFFPVLKILLGTAGLIALFYILFYYAVPFLLKSKTVNASRDLVILLTIVIAIGSTWLAHAVGLSPPLGAFLAGMLLAESPFATQIRTDIGSLRTLFVTIFFTSIGMLANPEWLLLHLHWVLSGLFLMIIGKTAIIYVISRLFDNNSAQALATGITLAQIGEFSFVLALTAQGFGLVGEDTFNWIVSVTIISIFLSPYMVTHARHIADRLIGELSKRTSKILPPESTIGKKRLSQIIIIGFGPAGHQVADGLIANGISPTVIEMRPPMAKIARKKGLVVHMGDAVYDDVLLHAGLGGSCMIVVTIPDPRIVMDITRNIRRLSPLSTIIARSRYDRHTQDIEKAGAHMTINEEVIVGRDLSAAVLSCLKDGGGPDVSCACSLAGLPKERT